MRHAPLSLAAVAALLLAGQALAQEILPVPAPQLPQGPVEPKRSWGPEQATGAPDTPEAGDMVTAWASLQPDAGEEWLKLGYDRAVDVAQVRVRETFNPGAVTKVTAFLANGQEVTLWEGADPTTQAPEDFVVDVTKPAVSQAIKVYLNSQKVRGWNEIDAVELVGKDKSHQWATSATASSTYAEQGVRGVDRGWVVTDFVRAAPPVGRDDLLTQFLEKPVTVHLEGQATLTGKLTGFDSRSLLLLDADGKKKTLINRDKVLFVEWVPEG